MENLDEYKKDLFNQFQELKAIAEVEKMIKDNKLVFELNDKIYRLHRPTYQDRVKAEKFVNRREFEMLKDKDYVTRAQLKDLWKEKGVDIEDMDRQIEVLQAEIHNIQLKLAETTDKKLINTYEKEIINIMNKQSDISAKKSDLLKISLEDQLETEANIYCIYILLEEKIDNDSCDNQKEWKPAFKSFEDFQNNIENNLVIKANYYLSILLSSSEIGVKSEE